MSNIGRLNQMLNYRSSLEESASVTVPARTVESTVRLEGFFPTIVAKGLQVLVTDISCHDAVDYQLAEPLKFFTGTVDGLSQILVGWFHQKIPGKIKGILFCHRLSSV
jgi:hypothetical protein